MPVYVVVQSTLEQSGWLDVFKFQISDCYFELLSFWWSTIIRFEPIELVKQKWVFSLESFNFTNSCKSCRKCRSDEGLLSSLVALTADTWETC